jgi:cytochrome P450
MPNPALLPSDPDFVLDLMGPEYDRDPYPILSVLREHAPAYEMPGFGALFLSRHSDVIEVLSNEELFSGDRTRWEHFEPPPAEHLNHPVIRMQSRNLLTAEGADHTRLRKLASAALTRRAVKNLDPLMHALADELIDRFIEGGQCDFTKEFAEIFPVNIVSRLMGIDPDSDRERRFKDLADSVVVAFNPMCSEEQKLRSFHSMTVHMEEIRVLMEEKRRNPGNDLMTDMVQAEDDASRGFEADEILGTLMAILVAGSETTANSLSFGLIELLKNPDQLARFRDDPSCRPNATAEIVRYQHPGRFLPRFAKEATVVAGAPVRAGQMIFCSVPSANRDPSVIEDPDRFDILRTPHDLSAFGVGRHFCIGAQLAKRELEVALSHILERLPNLEIAGSFDAIPYRANPAVRGPASLPIRFTPGAPKGSVS